MVYLEINTDDKKTTLSIINKLKTSFPDIKIESFYSIYERMIEDEVTFKLGELKLSNYNNNFDPLLEKHYKSLIIHRLLKGEYLDQEYINNVIEDCIQEINEIYSK